MCRTDNLLERIEFLRKEMTTIAIDKGFTSKESVTVSQELDSLLNLYNNLNRESKKV